MVAVQGKVVERFTKKPVIGAVVNVGGNIGYTNFNGQFSVTTNTGRQDLQVTANGYTPWFRNMNFKRAINRVGVIAIDSEIMAL